MDLFNLSTIIPTRVGEADVVVYVDGDFDLFHLSHALALERARSLGTFLLVGVHDDAVVNRSLGLNYPVMNLQEPWHFVLEPRATPRWITTRVKISPPVLVPAGVREKNDHPNNCCFSFLENYFFMFSYFSNFSRCLFFAEAKHSFSFYFESITFIMLGFNFFSFGYR